MRVCGSIDSAMGFRLISGSGLRRSEVGLGQSQSGSEGDGDRVLGFEDGTIDFSLYYTFEKEEFERKLKVLEGKEV